MSEAFEGMMVTPSVKLVRPLGQGGMGAVWVADHLALRTQVVVKFIASGLKTNKEAQERFSREAAAASQVKSPHVVQTFDHGITDEGIPYIVMELLDGRDLGEHLDGEVRMAPDLVVEVVGQLARALDRAHEKGIIHRDIKPGNIYLCDAGRSGEVFVKLLDFGIAKGVEVLNANGIDSGTKTGSMIGSPFYMSPEQILGSKNIDHRSDLWSVGVVAFEMLTGRKPFDAETMGGLAIKIHSEPLPAPTKVMPDLDPAVDAWFERACARDVEQRFNSAKELAEELSRALGGEMPRSLDAGPRISTGGNRVSSRQAPALATGAATDAGVVRGETQSRSRGRLLVLVGIFLVVPPLAYVGFSKLFKKAPVTNALVVPESTRDPQATPLASAGAGAGPGTATVILTTASATPPPPPDSAMVASSALPVRPVGPGGGGHGNRIRPPASARTPAVPSVAPSLPAVPAVTAPRPATSNDIF